MHTLTLEAKYTFGDHVSFDSVAQGYSGDGTVMAITFDDQRQIDYILEIKRGSHLQPGIYEDEITTPGGRHILTIQTKYTFGDRVRFGSARQGCSGRGTICAITIAADRQIEYMVEIDMGTHSDLQPYILEDEIRLLEDNAS